MTYWPSPTSSENNCHWGKEPHPQKYSITQKPKLELEKLHVQAGPASKSWILLPAGVNIFVMAKAVSTWGNLFNLLSASANLWLPIWILRKKRKSKKLNKQLGKHLSSSSPHSPSPGSTSVKHCSHPYLVPASLVFVMRYTQSFPVPSGMWWAM